MKNNIFDFSPPPWKWEKGKLGGHFMNDKNGNEIFDDGSNSGEYGSDLSKDFSDLDNINKANIRLISCAPEMLYSLINLTLFMKNEIQNLIFKNNFLKVGSFQVEINKNIKLIEKATGKKWEEIIKEFSNK